MQCVVRCAVCGETNLTFVDLSQGMRQSYVEACQVCCRPNVLAVQVNEEIWDVSIGTEYAG
ncbi:MAG: CPXCG motif-containing cysteine-rich protein [Spirulina sp. SIO3F2]|nr:CPXCG motif-containing cysteine-rich protein [Spirulina sp. SIO3F2]